MGEKRTRNWMIGAGTASVMAAAVTAAAVFGGQQTRPETPALRLTAAGSCEDLTATLRQRLVSAYDEQVDEVERNRPPWWDWAYPTGTQGPSGAAAAPGGASETARAPVPGTDYSTTNNQEDGVDEGDRVKSDGRSIVSVHSPSVTTYGPVASSNATLRVTGTQPLAAAGSLDLGKMNGADLFLDGNTVTVIGGVADRVAPVQAPVPPGGATSRSGAASNSVAPVYRATTSTRVVVIDISDRAAPKVVRSVTMDGTVEATRSVQGKVRLVLRGSPPVTASPYASDPEGVRKRLAATTAEEWLPMYRVDGPGAKPERLSDCRQTLVGGEIDPRARPATVVTIDPAKDRPLGAATVLNGATTVYATTDRVYLAGAQRSTVSAPQSTLVDAVQVAPDGKVTPAAQAKVPGVVNDQFSFSEHNGHLRVASTVTQPTSGPAILRREVTRATPTTPDTDSMVTVFAARDLAQVGQVNNLGKPGERIKGVRLLGDQGYVVTFRQTDPLYVLDLRDPRRPAVSGELTIPGYSAYLHPIGDGKLIGVGADADANGRVRGTKVSLYDVAGPSRPAELSTLVYPSQRTQAEFDHHAFLWWPKTRHVVIPLSGRMVAVKVDGTRLAEAGSITQPGGGKSASTPLRSLVIGENLYAVSDAGISADNLGTFARTGWVAFN